MTYQVWCNYVLCFKNIKIALFGMIYHIFMQWLSIHGKFWLLLIFSKSFYSW